MNAKLQAAIKKTIKDGPNIPVSVLRPRAGDYDELGATRLVRNGERGYFGTDRPTDAELVERNADQGAILNAAIDRAGRRR